jgi:hypothetical protein
LACLQRTFRGLARRDLLSQVCGQVAQVPDAGSDEQQDKVSRQAPQEHGAVQLADQLEEQQIEQESQEASQKPDA